MVLVVIVAGIIKFINFRASIVDPLYKSITGVQSFFFMFYSAPWSYFLFSFLFPFLDW